MLQRTHQFKTAALVIMILLCGSAVVWGAPQDVTNDKPAKPDPIEVGYAVITPAGNALGLVVFETFGEHRIGEVTQAGVLPSDMTKHCLMYVSTSGHLSKNLGIAIANPGTTPANVTLKLWGEKGGTTPVAEKPITVAAKNQSATFVTELFSAKSDIVSDFVGTLEITSNADIAVVGLRFRGLNFSTLPVTNLSPSTPVPQIATGIGGAGAVILAHLATGGGWASEIVIANYSTSKVTVRVDLFAKDGTPLEATFNGKTASSFTDIPIESMGVATLSPKDDE